MSEHIRVAVAGNHVCVAIDDYELMDLSTTSSHPRDRRWPTRPGLPPPSRIRPDLDLDASSGRWPEEVEIRITMPPMLAALGQEKARQLLRAELDRQLEEAQGHVRQQGWTVIGAARCQRVSPYQRATS